MNKLIDLPKPPLDELAYYLEDRIYRLSNHPYTRANPLYEIVILELKIAADKCKALIDKQREIARSIQDDKTQI